MPQTIKEKQALVDEITTALENNNTVYLTNFQGLTVAQTNELRSRFFEKNVSYRVFKNTLIERALRELDGYEDLIEHLHGPTAIAFSEEPAVPARVIKDFLDDEGVERPELKAAYIDGDFYGADQLDTLASLKSKDELIGDIIALLQAPITNVVRGLQDQGSTIAGCIEAIAENAEA